MAPFEGLVPGRIADDLFAHERGFRAAIFNRGVFDGINVAGPISGSIYQTTASGPSIMAWLGGFILTGLMSSCQRLYIIALLCITLISVLPTHSLSSNANERILLL